MAATAQIPVSVSEYEYLHTAYEVDCDYVDGAIEERAVGEYDHATWQKILIQFFGEREIEWGICVPPELRVRMAGGRYRIPDVCLLRQDAPIEQVVTHSPLVVFEILSPEDRLPRVMGRLADFEAMGIPAIWVIEPRDNSFFLYAAGRCTPAQTFHLPGTEIRVEMAEIAAMIRK
jgi:Uma2 family endonuclease